MTITSLLLSILEDLPELIKAVLVEYLGLDSQNVGNRHSMSLGRGDAGGQAANSTACVAHDCVTEGQMGPAIKRTAAVSANGGRL